MAEASAGDSTEVALVAATVVVLAAVAMAEAIVKDRA